MVCEETNFIIKLGGRTDKMHHKLNCKLPGSPGKKENGMSFSQRWLLANCKRMMWEEARNIKRGYLQEQCHSRGQSPAERSVELETEGVKEPRKSATGMGPNRAQNDEAGSSKHREVRSQCTQWTPREILEMQASTQKSFRTLLLLNVILGPAASAPVGNLLEM